LYVPRGVEVELPFEAHHWLCGEAGSAFPHTLIIAEERSRVTLVDVLRSAGEDAGMVCGVNDLWLGAGAQVTYVSVQDWSRRVAGWQVNATVVGRDARATALALQLGGAHVRSENVSRLRGQGVQRDLEGVERGLRHGVWAIRLRPGPRSPAPRRHTRPRP
jgi:Fe-S cluster assembly protein SufD